MRNTPVGEEDRHDHMHVGLHFIMPHPTSEDPPRLVATSARHMANHLIATGPLFAVALPDSPYPVPGQDFPNYVKDLLADAIDLIDAHPELICPGTHGRKIPPRILPQPLNETHPLW